MMEKQKKRKIKLHNRRTWKRSKKEQRKEDN